MLIPSLATMLPPPLEIPRVNTTPQPVAPSLMRAWLSPGWDTPWCSREVRACWDRTPTLSSESLLQVLRYLPLWSPSILTLPTSGKALVQGPKHINAGSAQEELNWPQPVEHRIGSKKQTYLRAFCVQRDLNKSETGNRNTLEGDRQSGQLVTVFPALS